MWAPFSFRRCISGTININNFHCKLFIKSKVAYVYKFKRNHDRIVSWTVINLITASPNQVYKLGLFSVFSRVSMCNSFNIPIGKHDTVVGNTLSLSRSLYFTRIDNLRVYAKKFPEMLRFFNNFLILLMLIEESSTFIL